MKVLCLLVLLGLPSTLTAQKPSTSGAPDLLIIAHKLGRILRVDVSPPGPFPELEGNSSIATEINPPSYQSQVKSEIKLRNTGARTIKSVGWEVFLIEDHRPTIYTTIYTVQSMSLCVRKTIRPGNTKRLSQWIRGYDLRAWSRRQKEGLLQVRTNIVSIKYADGSVWKGGPLRLP